MAGAADGVFLRSVGGGRFIFGLDHWGTGTVESAPTVVAPGVAHTVEIELGSLFTPESVPPDRVRVWFNGVVVIDAKHPLHPVKPGQMTAGRSPLGMPTAGRFLEV